MNRWGAAIRLGTNRAGKANTRGSVAARTKTMAAGRAMDTVRVPAVAVAGMAMAVTAATANGADSATVKAAAGRSRRDRRRGHRFGNRKKAEPERARPGATVPGFFRFPPRRP